MLSCVSTPFILLTLLPSLIIHWRRIPLRNGNLCGTVYNEQETSPEPQADAFEVEIRATCAERSKDRTWKAGRARGCDALTIGCSWECQNSKHTTFSHCHSTFLNALLLQRKLHLQCSLRRSLSVTAWCHFRKHWNHLLIVSSRALFPSSRHLSLIKTFISHLDISLKISLRVSYANYHTFTLMCKWLMISNKTQRRSNTMKCLNERVNIEEER